jgi:hypothetical protein
MVGLRLAAVGFCLGLAAVAPPSGALAQAAKAATPKSAPPAAKVDPAAIKALSDMSAFLQSLNGFELTSQTSLDVVATNDQKIQLDGATVYKVRKGAGFVIDVVSDIWNRRYVYDGRQFTLYAPTLGYFATVPAPATNRETISEVEAAFGVSLPLDDLFHWAEAGSTRADALTAAYKVGSPTIDGVKTNHYAFRQDRVDWQIWIQADGQPLPRKVVIVDRQDVARPAYIARLSWRLNPPLTDEDFVFRPASDAKRIRLALQEGVAP